MESDWIEVNWIEVKYTVEKCALIIFDNEKKKRIPKILVLLIFKLYFSHKAEVFVR